MCSAIICNAKSYNTPRQVAAWLGADRIVWRDPDLPANALDLCLCPIDIEATLTRAGRSWRQGVDPMEYFVSP